MLVLFETPAGYAVFKLLDDKKLKDEDNIYKYFETAEKASSVVKLKHFKKFEDITESLAAATANIEGKLGKPLKKLLKKIAKEGQEGLMVADAKLGGTIKERLDLPCVSGTAVHELIRGIRSQMSSLITGLQQKELAAFALGLAHSLSRYKLKFSPDKIDTMIIQAVSLLDDIDKELNNYIMRAREWYGWHFPELGKLISDNAAYTKVVMALGDRSNVTTTDLTDFIPEELIEEVKQQAEVSMGSEVSEEDIATVLTLCEQIREMSEYRTQLYDYLKNRMAAIAPNLTVLVGELVGARLISHAGSLMNLAKHPSSTVQILGAEKALFRALKTKHDTPKYGLIYHASLVGQSNPKLKGKVSRMLAAKASLAIRVDALGDTTDASLGAEHRANLEARLNMLETGQFRKLSGTGKLRAKTEKYVNKSEIRTYDAAADSTIPTSAQKSSKKRKHKEVKQEVESAEEEEVAEPVDVPKKKKKKSKGPADEAVETPKSEKKKKKKVKQESD